MWQDGTVIHVHVLVLEGVFDLGLSSVLDTFGIAQALSAELGLPARSFVVRPVGVRRRVRTGHGLAVPVEPADRVPAPDLVIVPAIDGKTPDGIDQALARSDLVQAGRWLRRWHGQGAVVGAACTGTFVLAASALLDGRKATTTWWLAPHFRARFPAVLLDDSRMVVEADRLVTAGAALAHIDLALWFVRQRSPVLADLTARYLVVDPRPSQSVFAVSDHLAHHDPLVSRFEGWARGHLAERFSLGAAARSVGASQRTLSRHLQRVLGKSPLSYVRDLRVERALHLLHTSDATIEEIAAQVGYGDGVTLRTLLRRKTGRGIRDLRARPKAA
jgi:transcriptional regulator GlxA family with amidase domain